jgi:hypothetical protein
MDDKNTILIPVVVFNIVFMAYQFFFNWFESFTWGGLFIGLLVGAVAAGISFGVLSVIKK